MPGHLPTLDPETLKRLRALVQRVREGEGRSLPMQELVNLADEAELQGGVTIDFEATPDLGEPLVVVRLPATPRPHSSLEGLSPREREVAELLARGLDNKTIATKLFVSVATVKDHVHNILDKTGLTNRTAVAAAWRGQAPDDDSRDR